jgi:hypothetical protein
LELQIFAGRREMKRIHQRCQSADRSDAQRPCPYPLHADVPVGTRGRTGDFVVAICRFVGRFGKSVGFIGNECARFRFRGAGRCWSMLISGRSHPAIVR